MRAQSRCQGLPFQSCRHSVTAQHAKVQVSFLQTGDDGLRAEIFHAKHQPGKPVLQFAQAGQQ
jgi:hypothetical protein